MNIRTIMLSIALATAAIAAPPAISTARACGGYMSAEMFMGREVARQIAPRWGVARDQIDVLAVEIQPDGSAEVDVRIRTGKQQAIGRRYAVSISDRGYRVTATPLAWVERLTKDGWAHA